MDPSLGPRALSGWTAGEGGAFGLNVSPWGLGWSLVDARQCEEELCCVVLTWWSSDSEECCADAGSVIMREKDFSEMLNHFCSDGT